MCSSTYQASMSASAAAGTDIDTAISTGGASPAPPESLIGVYSRRSIVAADMIDFSRADALSHTAWYAAPSSVPGLIS